GPLADAPVVVMTRPWLYISREKLASRAGYEVLNQTRTDQEGRFRLTALLPAEELSPQEHRPSFVQVVAAAPGHGPGWAPLYPNDVRVGRPADVTLRLSPESPLHARLIDLQGQPAAHVRLEGFRIGSEMALWYQYFDEVDQVHFLMESRRKPGADYPEVIIKRPAVIAFWEAPAGLPVWPEPVVTDAQGRFVLHGIGPEHGVGLLV